MEKAYKIIEPKLLFSIFLALAISLSVLLTGTVINKVIIAIAFTSAIFTFMNPKIYFILFLILRPSIDLMSERQIIEGVNITSAATIFLLLVGGIVLFRRDNLTKIRENSSLLNVNKLFLTFLFITLFSFVNTESFLISFADWLRFVSVIVVFNCAYVYFSNEKSFKILFFSILASTFLPIFIGITQYLFKTGNQATPGFNRIYGTFVHPNAFAQYLAIIFLMTAYYLRTYKNKFILKTGLYLFLILTVFCIYHTYTRGTWIALAISIILLGLNYKKAKKFVFYLLLTVILFSLLPDIQERFRDIQYSKPGRMSSWDWRIMIWNRTKEEIKNRPIIGHGLGMYQENFSFAAHNDYLRLAYETGASGLLVYLFCLFYIFTKSVKFVLTFKDNSKRSQYITMLSLIVFLLIVSVADNLARATVILIYLFCVMGALLDVKVNADRAGT